MYSVNTEALCTELWLKLYSRGLVSDSVNARAKMSSLLTSSRYLVNLKLPNRVITCAATELTRLHIIMPKCLFGLM